MSLFSPKFKRREQGITNYKKRFSMLKSKLPRVVVRVTNKRVLTHATEFMEKGDKTTVFVDSAHLKTFGWKHSIKSIPAAYLTGVLLASTMKERGLNHDCIIDLGIKTNTKGSRIFAVLKGAADAGLKFPHSTDYFPSDDRVSGKHIDTYRKTDVSKDFADLKAKIMSGAAKVVKSEKKKAKSTKTKAVKENKEDTN
ncbi:MAG: 50S ribosomal protein L18 [Nanoarchaeota archaeon]|nr:50S ribosomal protein L18 [Nanoarchaeota archaeon]MBU4452365.1 50S ribosomal protein L18 [Nanoarchaeota archaeon]MCG2723359.1 50S ribosomal protein L18 [archaeon]